MIGSQAAHPVMITCGNFRWWVRQSDRAWITVGLIPVLNASKVMKDTAGFKEFKMWMYHESWRHLMSPLVEANSHGGVYVDVCSQRRKLVPVVCFFSQDSPEVKNLISHNMLHIYRIFIGYLLFTNMRIYCDEVLHILYIFRGPILAVFRWGRNALVHVECVGLGERTVTTHT